MRVPLEIRLASVEKTVQYLKSQMDEQLMKDYDVACSEKDEERASELLREIRNRILSRTDKEFTIDRIQLDLTNPVSFIKSLKNLKNSEIAKTRQALRDLPLQTGFPFEVVLPLSLVETDSKLKL